ncbi:hypothetical protein [Flavobacterium sp.]|jgi:hypothetical protein|uniref:hypothetical protein n=1 Tax=Flavobacterium sp. TaxID=239 RepID=UPI0037C13DC4
MKALISKNEIVKYIAEWTIVDSLPIPIVLDVGMRIVQICEIPFEVHSDLFWVDCQVDLDINSKAYRNDCFINIPSNAEKPQQPTPIQPTVTGAQTL